MISNIARPNVPALGKVNSKTSISRSKLVLKQFSTLYADTVLLHPDIQPRTIPVLGSKISLPRNSC